MLPMDKARVAVSSPLCSTQRHNGALRQTPPYFYGEGNLYAGGSCKSSPESKNRVHLQTHHAQLRKKRNKSKKEPVWRSSTGASGLFRRRSGGSG
jgi:hypothetical protein